MKRLLRKLLRKAFRAYLSARDALTDAHLSRPEAAVYRWLEGDL